MPRESWAEVLVNNLQPENLSNKAVAKSVSTLVQAVSDSQLPEQKQVALLLRVCQEAFQTLKDAPQDAALLRACTVLATALASNPDLPPKAITSALKLQGFFVACAARSMNITTLKALTYVVRWVASLPNDVPFEEEAYTKLALHLIAAIPAFFKANQQITADAVKIAATWIEGSIPKVLAKLQQMQLPDALSRHLQSAVQSLLATACSLSGSVPQFCGVTCTLIDALVQTTMMNFLQVLMLLRRSGGAASTMLPRLYQSLYDNSREVWATNDTDIIGMLVLAEDINRSDSADELAVWCEVRSFEFQSRINQMLALALSEAVGGSNVKDARRRRPWELLSASDTSAWVASLVGVTDPPQAELITKIIVCCTEQILTGVRKPQKKASNTKRAALKQEPEQQHQHLHGMMSFALRLLQSITAARSVSLQGICDRCVRQVMRAVTIVADYAHDPGTSCVDLQRVLENLTSMCLALFPAVDDSLYQTLSRCVQTNLHRLHRLRVQLSNDFMARLLSMQTMVGLASTQHGEFVAMLAAAARLLPVETACHMLLATMSAQQLDNAVEHMLIAQLMSMVIKGLCDDLLSLGQAGAILVTTIKQSPLHRKQTLMTGLCKAVAHGSAGLVVSPGALSAMAELLDLLEQDSLDPMWRCMLLYCRAHLIWAAQALANSGDHALVRHVNAYLDKAQPEVEKQIQSLCKPPKNIQTKKKPSKTPRSKQRAKSTASSSEESVFAPLLRFMGAALRCQWQLQQRYHREFVSGITVDVDVDVDVDDLQDDSTAEATSDEESDEERTCANNVDANLHENLVALFTSAQAAVHDGPYAELLDELQLLLTQIGFMSGVQHFEQLQKHLDASTAEMEVLLLWMLLHVSGASLDSDQEVIPPALFQQYHQLTNSTTAHRDDYEQCLTLLARVQCRQQNTSHDLFDVIKFLAAAKLALAAGDFVSAARFGRYVVLCTNSPFDKAYGGRLSVAKLTIRAEALLLMAEVWDCIGTPDSAVTYLTQADKLARSIVAAAVGPEHMNCFAAKAARLWGRIGQAAKVSAELRELPQELPEGLSEALSFPTFSQAWDSRNCQSDRVPFKQLLHSETTALLQSLESLPPVIFAGMKRSERLTLPDISTDALREELPRCSFDCFRDACRMLSLRYLLDPNASVESVWRCAAASIYPSAAGQLLRRSGVLDTPAAPVLQPSDLDHGAAAFWDATLLMPENGSHLSEIKQMLFELKAQPQGADASVSFACSLRSNVLLLGRLSVEGAPLTVALQCEDEFVSILETWQELMERNIDQLHGTRDAKALQQWTTQSKEAWWNGRHKLDDDVSECLDKLQAMFGPWRCLLAPQDTLPDEKSTKHLQQLVQQIVQALCNDSKKQPQHDMFSDWISALLLAFPMLSEEELLQGVRHVMLFRTGCETIPSSAVEIIQEAIEFVESCNDYFSLGSQQISAFDAAIQSAAEEEKKEEGKEETMDWHSMTVTQLRDSLKAADLPTTGRKAELIARLEEHHTREQSDTSMEPASKSGKCSILMLDEQIQSMCFESMPTLRRVATFRMPGLSLLEELLSRQQRTHSLSVEDAWYVVDPENNLPNTRKTMSEFLAPYASRWGWSGYVAEAPSKEVVRDLHEHSDAFIYCGHGAGERLCQRQKLERFTSCPAAFLWGCSSGRLQPKGIHDPTGAAISYLLAGAPLVVGNLWDVTDRDIDRVSMECMRLLFDPVDGAKAAHQVPTAVVEARDACKLYYAVGCAAVCYGLPVPVRSEK